MRVLHVNDYAAGDGRGGTEIYLARLIAAQRLTGTEVDVLTGNGSHAGPRKALDLWDPRARRRLAERVRVFRPDVVHLHNVLRELSPSVLVPTGVPTVMTFHDLRSFGGSEHQLPDPRAVVAKAWLDPVMRRRVKQLAAVVGVSETVADVLRSKGVQARAIPVPVPEPVVEPQPVAECQDVLFAGRLSPDKGVDVLVEAFGRIAARHPSSRLLIAGDGPLVPRAGELLGRLSAAAVSEAMGRSRVVVVPSVPGLRREGSSLTSAEAARHGRVLITSDDPAVAEVARLVGGDVVPAGDVSALAARLDHWLRDADAARVAGEAARTASTIYDPAEVVASYAEVYASR